MTLGISDTAQQRSAIIPNVIILSGTFYLLLRWVIMLSVDMLNVVILSVIKLGHSHLHTSLMFNDKARSSP